MECGRLRPGRLAILLLLGVLGCSRKTLTYNEDVSGTVKFEGVPLADVWVEFVPEVDPTLQAPRSLGQTDDKGHFQLMCENQKPGAVVGHHRVIVARAKPGRKDPPVQLLPAIPQAYNIASQTPLEADVSDAPASYEFNLISDPPPRFLGPAPK